MGSALNPTIASVLMGHNEQKIIPNFNIKYPNMRYVRYMDIWYFIENNKTAYQGVQLMNWITYNQFISRMDILKLKKIK